MSAGPLIYGVWQWLLIATATAAAAVPIVWFVCRRLKHVSPVIRHQLWLGVLLVVMTVPLLRIHGPSISLPILPSRSEIQHDRPDIRGRKPAENRSEAVKEKRDAATPNAINTTASVPSGDPRADAPWRAWIVAIWALGALFMLIRLALSAIRLQGLSKRASAAESELPPPWNTDASKVKISKEITSPICGGIRPVILLPRALIEKASPDDLRMILTHETAHLKRYDHIVIIFQRVMESLLFFHPFIRLAGRELTRERELICDQHVTCHHSRTSYAKLLARLIEPESPGRPAQAVALAEGNLLTRVSAILTTDRGDAFTVSQRIRLTVALAVVAIGLIVGTVRLDARNRSPRELVPPPVGNASIRGQVVSSDTGKPIENATLHLFHLDTYGGLFVQTEKDGTFHIDNIAHGSYGLRVFHTAGYRDAEYDPNGYGRKGGYPKFTLAPDQHLMNVTIPLQPAGSISGRIIGEAPEKVLVIALAQHDGDDFLEVRAQARPSHDGIYTLEGLGETPVFIMTMLPNPETAEGTYCPHYYPGTYSLAEATPVIPVPDRTIENIDISITPTPGIVLTGNIETPNGAPVDGALVIAHPEKNFAGFAQTYTDKSGHFRFSCLGLGAYLVHADGSQHNLVRRSHTVQVITPKKGAVLDFVLNRGVRITGRIVDEQGNPWSVSRSHGVAGVTDIPTRDNYSFGMTGMRNRNQTESHQIGHGSHLSPGQGDYDTTQMIFPTKTTFLLEGVAPGHTVLHFYPKEQDFDVKEILFNGKDIRESGITTTAGDEIEDIVIVVEKSKTG